jgi:hypothetical protein
MDNYKILCDIGEEITFIIGGKFQKVELAALDDENNLTKIIRIQFKRAPKTIYFEKVQSILKKKPNITLRFYGDYSEDKIDWEQLTEIQNLQIDLWNTVSLKDISLLKSLKSIGISKNINSKVSLTILEPLQNLETLYTSVSKDINVIGKLKKLQKISLYEIKKDNLDFLSSLNDLRILWLSLGSFKDFTGIKEIINLERLWIQQVRGFDNDAADILSNCKMLWALKLDNLKHLTRLDFVKTMLNLKYLSLEGIRNLDTYCSVADSKSIETIVGYQCQPIDKSLTGLKNLKNIQLGDSYKKSEIDNFLNITRANNIWLRGKQLKGINEMERPFRI